jgi:hypothetical protein
MRRRLQSRAEIRQLAAQVQESIMTKLYVCLSLCSVFLLHGCFDSSKNTTKNNTDGSKSSVQMQEGKADESK